MNNLVESVALKDIFSQPTETKTINPSTEQSLVNTLDFAPEPSNGTFHESQPDPIPVEPVEPYDAEAEAEKLVGMLNAGNTVLVSPLANWRMIKKRGGREGLEKMKAPYMKKMKGEKLSEEEEVLYKSFESFQADMKLLNGEIPYSEQQLEAMKKLAVPYCQESQIHINGGLAFWIAVSGMQIEKIIKVLTA